MKEYQQKEAAYEHILFFSCCSFFLQSFDGFYSFVFQDPNPSDRCFIHWHEKKKSAQKVAAGKYLTK